MEGEITVTGPGHYVPQPGVKLIRADSSAGAVIIELAGEEVRVEKVSADHNPVLVGRDRAFVALREPAESLEMDVAR